MSFSNNLFRFLRVIVLFGFLCNQGCSPKLNPIQYYLIKGNWKLKQIHVNGKEGLAYLALDESDLEEMDSLITSKTLQSNEYYAILKENNQITMDSILKIYSTSFFTYIDFQRDSIELLWTYLEGNNFDTLMNDYFPWKLKGKYITLSYFDEKKQSSLRIEVEKINQDSLVGSCILENQDIRFVFISEKVDEVNDFRNEMNLQMYIDQSLLNAQIDELEKLEQSFGPSFVLYSEALKSIILDVIRSNPYLSSSYNLNVDTYLKYEDSKRLKTTIDIVKFRLNFINYLVSKRNTAKP